MLPLHGVTWRMGIRHVDELLRRQRRRGSSGHTDMETQKGEPSAGQTYTKATAVEWQWERREYESYSDPLPLLFSPSLSFSISPSPGPPPPPHVYSADVAGLRRSWLIHSESRAYFCHTVEIVLLRRLIIVLWHNLSPWLLKLHS